MTRDSVNQSADPYTRPTGRPSAHPSGRARSSPPAPLPSSASPRRARPVPIATRSAANPPRRQRLPAPVPPRSARRDRRFCHARSTRKVPTRVATTGTPSAWASTTTMPYGSSRRRYDAQGRVLEQSQHLGCGNGPRNRTRGPSPLGREPRSERGALLSVARDPEWQVQARPHRCPGSEQEVEPLLLHHPPRGKAVRRAGSS